MSIYFLIKLLEPTSGSHVAQSLLSSVLGLYSLCSSSFKSSSPSQLPSSLPLLHRLRFLIAFFKFSSIPLNTTLLQLFRLDDTLCFCSPSNRLSLLIPLTRTFHALRHLNLLPLCLSPQHFCVIPHSSFSLLIHHSTTRRQQ